jgi:hypothetical protein
MSPDVLWRLRLLYFRASCVLSEEQRYMEAHKSN